MALWVIQKVYQRMLSQWKSSFTYYPGLDCSNKLVKKHERSTECFSNTCQVQFATQLLHPLVLGLIKASFIMFYRRTFYVGQRNWFSVFTAFILGFILVWSITFCLIYVLYCGSYVSAIWGKVIGIITYCAHSFQFQQAFAVTDFIMDFIVILAPVPLVRRVCSDCYVRLQLIVNQVLQIHLTWPRTLSVMVIFLLGVM